MHIGSKNIPFFPPLPIRRTADYSSACVCQLMSLCEVARKNTLDTTIYGTAISAPVAPRNKVKAIYLGKSD